MTDLLIRIKRSILAGHYAFSEKARIEMEIDAITEMDVTESILNAVAIYKTIRSRSPYRKFIRENLYIIQSTNLEGLPIYTKGKLVSEFGNTIYYFLISSKKSSEVA
jgi:ribosomal protein S3